MLGRLPVVGSTRSLDSHANAAASSCCDSNAGQSSAVLGSGDIPQATARNQGSSAGLSRPAGAASSKAAGVKRSVKSEMVDLSSRPLAKVPKREPGLLTEEVSADAEPELIDLT